MKNQELAEVIKLARENKGISQRELARRIDADNSLLAKLEKGLIAKPGELLLRKISSVLNINEEEILKLAGYSEEDIIFITTLSEKNVIDYFSSASLYEVDQMIKRIDLEIKSATNLRNAMVHFDISKISEIDLDSKEKKKLGQDWKTQVGEHEFRIERLNSTRKQLDDMLNNRIQSGEFIVENDKDITSILDEYIKYIYNKNN